MAPIDQVHLSFNPQTLTLLNAVLGLVMFGVALELHVEDFKPRCARPRRWRWACWATICCFRP
jgi:BASS family bile acid:Na+ symporter